MYANTRGIAYFLIQSLSVWTIDHRMPASNGTLRNSTIIMSDQQTPTRPSDDVSIAEHGHGTTGSGHSTSSDGAGLFGSGITRKTTSYKHMVIETVDSLFHEAGRGFFRLTLFTLTRPREYTNIQSAVEAMARKCVSSRCRSHSSYAWGDVAPLQRGAIRAGIFFREIWVLVNSQFIQSCSSTTACVYR
ncbi:hypothetical protein FISHEDRAFT_63147 [Fistulina hepatica ATCC 64428]|uniref:Uncharacterized protein n=1 Tax=Fistulina hepatica ATCC 64428 TaxID=1128425 RepID=A0A0D6ZYB7_9AGAR|nr:hypothetical protein FISHEDRAFT_63147 [Fistulina hepatica ATCC 64428]